MDRTTMAMMFREDLNGVVSFIVKDWGNSITVAPAKYFIYISVQTAAKVVFFIDFSNK